MIRRFGAVVAFGAAALMFDDAQPSLVRTIPQNDPESALTKTSSVSADGAVVAFESLASLVPSDGNTDTISDVYVLELDSGRVELASVGPNGSPANGSSSWPRLSGDGRWLVFESTASNLVTSEVEHCPTVFLRDRTSVSTRAVARAHGGSGIRCAGRPAISEDGRIVAFESSAVDLVDGPDASGPAVDVYALDVGSGAVARVSVDTHGRQSRSGRSFGAQLSADGRYVAFTSTACLDRETLTAAETSAGCTTQVYVRDRLAGRTRPILTADGRWPNGPVYDAAISADGRYVAFTSIATNIVRGATSRVSQVYLHDTARGTYEFVSHTLRGTPGNGASSQPVISGDGRFVAFQSVASDLLCAARCAELDRDYNLVSDVFLLDRSTSRMRRLSRGPGQEVWWTTSVAPAMDAAARVFALSSRHPTGPADDRANFDLFVFKR